MWRSYGVLVFDAVVAAVRLDVRCGFAAIADLVCRLGRVSLLEAFCALLEFLWTLHFGLLLIGLICFVYKLLERCLWSALVVIAVPGQLLRLLL